ncbi:gluconokinase [Neolewinella lacunae]|uniref:Gluconokinase n=1 Tax=Neolewinella lacunae TaxID=1517758 RepID=A0A923T8G7_9BACT|nr:gluconokinase [Neolewinella lacunae]MBC6995605.1 gluconokinase [Neolewinella lacunae]MDN3635641.1 gluconokinase [Neolewinella lacunae]
MASSADYFIGLDLGTTSVKACAFDRRGQLLHNTNQAYPLEHPSPGAAIQDPALLLKAAEQALQDLIRESPGTPGGVGLSCPMHGIFLLDEQERPLTEIITWADTRAEVVMADFSPAQRRELLRCTGTPVHPMSPLVKYRWLRLHDPGLFAEARYVRGIKEILTSAWTGQAVLDEQLASATGLYDSVAGEWSALALAAATAPGAYTKDEPRLPTVRPATHQLTWLPEVADRLGLSGVPLFLGGSDGVLANLGSGLLSPEEVAITVGTSAAVRATHRQARIDPAHGLFNYRMLDDYYVVGGASNNGGKALEFWQELLVGHFTSVGEFINAGLSVAREDSPAFLPYLYGERAPIWDASATASLQGLRGFHDHRHLARAVLEGVTDNLLAILRQLEAAVGTPHRLHVSGGITQSPAWMDLLAERSGRPTAVADAPQASAYGAALIARLGTGDLASLKEI